MKLVTFDQGRVGRIDGDVVVELDCGSMREYFERGGEAGERPGRIWLAQCRHSKGAEPTGWVQRPGRC